MFCSKCGNIMPDGARYCSSCGARQERPATRVNVDCDHEHRGEAMSQEPVGFVDAIRLFFTRYIDFGGRSRRSEYWWVVLFLGIVSAFISKTAGTPSAVSSAWSFITFLPGLAINVRRLHDVGKSGFYLLWHLFPIVGQIMILVQMCSDSTGANQWGPNPKQN